MGNRVFGENGRWGKNIKTGIRGKIDKKGKPFSPFYIVPIFSPAVLYLLPNKHRIFPGKIHGCVAGGKGLLGKKDELVYTHCTVYYMQQYFFQYVQNCSEKTNIFNHISVGAHF